MTRLTAAAVRALLEGKRLLIFDFDGTLADTSALHEAAFNATLAPWGLRVDYPSVAGMRTRDAFAACFTAAGVNVPESRLHELVQHKQTHVRTLIRQELRPLPGVKEFLRWAKPRYRLALYSSGSRGTVTVAMEKLGYTDWFDPILCAEDVMHCKPHPEGFFRVLQIARETASHTLVFEDAESGLTAARAANLTCVTVCRHTFADFENIKG